MVLVDTSIWVEVLRDATGVRRRNLERALDGEVPALSRFQQLELLQGSRDEHEWAMLHSYLIDQEYLELGVEGWAAAARTYFDLRRQGKTVRSALDCCIAQVALDHDVTLLHCDRDFVTIATVRPLRQVLLRL